jgi:hypothetical protein
VTERASLPVVVQGVEAAAVVRDLGPLDRQPEDIFERKVKD